MTDTRVFHRHLHSTPPVAVSGSGMVLTDKQGRQYIDASGGAAVSCLGHGHPDVLAAMHAQVDKLAYAHTSFFTTEVAEALANHLVERAPAGMSHAYFVSGGSEAIEAAMKMARQYFVETGQPQRSHFIARRQSYHGNTLGALSVGGNQWRREPFAPILIPATHVAPCYPYREQRADESPEQYGQRLARELDETIERLGRRQGHRLHCRDGGRRDGGRAHAGAGVLQGRARGVRPPWRAAHSRRGDVRHGPHRDLARLRAGGGGARPAGDRQGAGRRLPADRCRAGAAADRARRCRRARGSSSTATPTSAMRWPARRRWRCRR